MRNASRRGRLTDVGQNTLNGIRLGKEGKDL
jgi:hypothetical protein